MGAGWRDTGLVFTHPDGSGLWPQMVTARFRKMADELGFPGVGVHGLRHSAAMWMIGQGTSPKLVQQRLGHAHVSVTLGLYSHVTPGHDAEAAVAPEQAVPRRSVIISVITATNAVAKAQVRAVRSQSSAPLTGCAPWDSNPEPAD